jgi:hypothetical protein
MTTLDESFRHYGPAYRARFGTRYLQASFKPCRRSKRVGLRHLAASFIPARPVSSPATAITPVATGIVQPANTKLARPGSPSNTPCSCRFPTSWSRTLPCELPALARAHPETIYRLLFRTSAAALQQLAQEPGFVGGQIGMLGVLQTWTRDLRYHPHIDYLVPALALTQMPSAGWSANTTFTCMSNRSVNCFGQSCASGWVRRGGPARLMRAPGPNRGCWTAGRSGARQAPSSISLPPSSALP